MGSLPSSSSTSTSAVSQTSKSNSPGGSIPCLAACVNPREGSVLSSSSTAGPENPQVGSPLQRPEAVGQSDVVTPQTLGDSSNNEGARLSADLYQRQLAYEKRRAEKREAKKNRKAGSAEDSLSKQFLSNLPEVESDVQYRYTFLLSAMGTYAKQVAEAACTSRAAESLPGAHDGNDDPPQTSATLGSVASSAEGSGAASTEAAAADGRTETPASLRKAGGAGKPLRCLASIVDTEAGPEAQVDKARLAKLVFHPMSTGEQIPPCPNRLEALNTALVYVLILDKDLSAFEAQLRSMAESVEDLRSRTRPRCRAVRAVVLCYTEQAQQTQELWADSLADFEAQNGDVWKFGPVGLWDADGLHSIFAEIAAVRIPLAAGGGAKGTTRDANGKLDSSKFATGDRTAAEDDEDNDYGKDGPEAAFLTSSLAGIQEVKERGPSFGSESSSMSTTSEGWQQPPVFEAESEGSECSEGALELHKRLFAIQGGGSDKPGPLAAALGSSS